jgi:quercetin dioxygenase-like cupin family protein
MAGAMTGQGNINIKGEAFVIAADIAWLDLGEGVRRKVLSHADNVMLVHVEFQTGAIGKPHTHPHLQCTLVESGIFDVTIGGRTRRLVAGDTFFVATNVLHGVVNIEAGRLVDSFTPMREDFVRP